MSVVESEIMDEVVDVSDNVNALAMLNKSEIDMQVSTAKRYPRSITKAKSDMLALATIDKETAERCGYALKRTDKDGKIVWIEGPSIRMAEIAVSCWGNLRYGARVIEENDRFVVAQGMCYDLEKNIASSMEVRRRITNRSGRKYSDDMIGTTANAACAIAARNAVFKIIPGAIVRNAYEEAMKVAGGDEKTFTKRRENAVAAFKAVGVTIEEIMVVLGKPDGGMEDLDAKDLRRLFGLLTAINDGETTADQVFRPEKSADASAAKDQAAETRERIKNAKQQKSESTPQMPPTPSKGDVTTQPEDAGGGELRTVEQDGQTEEDKLTEHCGGTWPEFVESLYSNAASIYDPDLTREQFNSGLGLAVMGIAKKTKEHTITGAKRKEWFIAMKIGKFDFANGKIRA